MKLKKRAAGPAVMAVAAFSIGGVLVGTTSPASAGPGHTGSQAFALRTWNGTGYSCSAPTSHTDLFGYAGATTDATYAASGYAYGCSVSWATVYSGYYPGPIYSWTSGWQTYRSDVISAVPANSSGSDHQACADDPAGGRSCSTVVRIFP